VVVVTGATRRIGRQTARRFEAEGATVVVVGRSSTAHPHPQLAASVEEAEEMLRAEGIEPWGW
jgi:NAD(P)-dependent dehydrogenase (short-subunit alcohol dehydrogenase family)